jgi:N4-gp56 family major capsid protein
MALGSNHTDVSAAADFLPEVWSDDIITSYKSNLVMANLVTKIDHRGKKGDTINIPAPYRGSASAKSEDTQVTVIAHADTNLQVSIDQHWEYSRVIEDVVEMQSLPSLRKFYTDDAGYALSTRVDTSLLAQVATWQGGTAYSKAVLGGDGTTDWTDGNGSALTDAGIRAGIQRLDEADVPMDYRYFVIGPSSRNTMMGIDRFTQEAFVGERGSQNTIRNGRIGNVYGVEVYVSNNLPGIGTGSDEFANPMFHKDALVLAEQMGIRVQTQYKQEYLGDLFTADTLYGVLNLRPNASDDANIPGAGIALVTP